MVTIQAFRAIDFPEECDKFIEGHSRVLTSIGVNKVTSNRHDWKYNPASFVILVKSNDDGRALGGARIHLCGGTQLLPIEDATCEMDAKILDIVSDYGQRGSGEVCGLWNSREVAGYGIGSVFLSRATLSIAKQLGLTSLFALCAPYTVAMAKSMGYTLLSQVGNEGTFYYPKLDLVATSMILLDLDDFRDAEPEQRDAILALRNEPVSTRKEILRNKELEISYDLNIPNLEDFNFKQLLNIVPKEELIKKLKSDNDIIFL